MPLLTSISTICSKLATGATFCAVAATTDVPSFETTDLCTAYYRGRLEGVLDARGADPVFSKASCHSPQQGKMILNALPGAFDDEGWLYTVKVSSYVK